MSSETEAKDVQTGQDPEPNPEDHSETDNEKEET